MIDPIIIGVIALDDVETPFGKRDGVLGGSCTYAGMAASFFANPGVVSVVGKDFPSEHLDLIKSKNVDIEGVETFGKTFRWAGSYEYDMNEAKTKKTEVNNLLQFDPKISETYKQAKYVFLANTDPAIQLKVLDQINPKAIVLMDTMNYWISDHKEKLLEVIKRVHILLLNDAEARQLFDTPNLIKAGRLALELGPAYVIIKKGEHGALMFSSDGHFSAPSYPLENLIDPTGAGDSFAGGLVGYLAAQDKFDDVTMRKAIIYGSTIASFCAEGFSVEKLKSVTRDQVEERYQVFQKIREF